jgi:homoserine O-acetyltransferase
LPVLWMTAGGLRAADQASPLETFEAGPLQLAAGETLASCPVGYRTYGELNAAKDNAILFPTWFSGRSEQLAEFVGADKLLDPSRYFIITVDALGNGVSCSPSNHEGTFPNIRIADMVASQHKLVTQKFGIKRLHAVVGISMGGMQTFEWLVAYPGFARKAVPIIGSPKLTTSDLLLWQSQLNVIEMAEEAGKNPRDAMATVLAIHNFALYTPDYQAAKNPPSQFPAMMERLAKEAREGMDPRDWAAQLRAMIAHDVTQKFGSWNAAAAAAAKTKALVVVASQDHMVHPQPARDFASLGRFRLMELEGFCGHMATSCESARFYSVVSRFLSE